MMEFLRLQLARMRRDEEGVTTVEYAVMIGLVALAVALATPGISQAVIGMFTAVASAINNLLTP